MKLKENRERVCAIIQMLPVPLFCLPGLFSQSFEYVAAKEFVFIDTTAKRLKRMEGRNKIAQTLSRIEEEGDCMMLRLARNRMAWWSSISSLR